MDEKQYISQKKLTDLKVTLAELHESYISDDVGIRDLTKCHSWWCPKYHQKLSICSSECPHYKEVKGDVAVPFMGKVTYKLCSVYFQESERIQKIGEVLETQDPYKIWIRRFEGSHTITHYALSAKPAVTEQVKPSWGNEEYISGKKIIRQPKKVINLLKVQINSTDIPALELSEKVEGIVKRVVNKYLKIYIVQKSNMKALRAIAGKFEILSRFSIPA